MKVSNQIDFVYLRNIHVQYDLVIRGGYVPDLPANNEKPRITDGVSKRLYIRY